MSDEQSAKSQQNVNLGLIDGQVTGRPTNGQTNRNG